jgi:hypothetical protein
VVRVVFHVRTLKRGYENQDIPEKEQFINEVKQLLEQEGEGEFG